MNKNIFEVIIVGGSYAGLSAAMTLGRSLRKALVIDSGKPANRFTPYAHNFITHDGAVPKNIASAAKLEVLRYETIQFLEDKVIEAEKSEKGYRIRTQSGQNFGTSKIIFATGVKDELPDLEGLSACWGRSVIHCPYCHGYEVKGKKTGIWINDESAMDFYQLIDNWTDEIVIFTNGKVKFDTTPFRAKKVLIEETEISYIVHQAGYLSQLVLKNGTKHTLESLYFRPPFEQHCKLPEQLGCELTESGHIKVDQFQKTNISGIYAAGDCTTLFRSLAVATAQGSTAGAMLNHELIAAKSPLS